MLGMQPVFSQGETYTLGQFNDIIVSPHIAVEFHQGDKNKIEVLSLTKGNEKKLNVDVKNKTLHLYLDDARITTKSEKYKNNSYKKPIYSGTVATLKVTYTKLNSCEIRGEQAHEFVSAINQKEFKLSIFGEASVTMNEVVLNDFRVSIYGESELHMGRGSIENQKFTAYGESKIFANKINNDTTKLTIYGEGEYNLHVNETLTLTSFGEAVINYSGNGTLNQKIIIGETTINKKS